MQERLAGILTVALLTTPLAGSASSSLDALPEAQTANLRLVETLQHVARTQRGLAAAVAMVAEATGVAGRLDGGHFDSQGSLVDVLSDLMGESGISPGDADRLQQLPAEVSTALADLVTAFTEYRGTTLSLAPVLSSGSPSPEAFAPVRVAQVRMLTAADQLSMALAIHPATLFGPPILVPPVLALELAGEDNTYTKDFALLIDVGGNDLYMNNAGGSASLTSILGACPQGPLLGLSPGAAALFDFAGHDRYASQRSCGINGGGGLGAGFLLDAAGNDEYVAGSAAVNGGGGLGVGLLVDLDGNDMYVGGEGAVNGGGVLGGNGLLIDMAGSDVYQASEEGVNGGSEFGGVGMLIDLSGNDAYTGTDLGVNGGASGLYLSARGFLADFAGNDSYTAGHGGVNGGSWVGVGFLYDAKGDDSYVAERLGANGEADPVLGCFVICYVNHAAGLLLDGGGRDTYSDFVGGSGVDRTVVPKGLVGAQIDLAPP